MQKLEDMKELLNDCIDTAEEYVPKLLHGLQSAAGHLENSKKQEALTILGQAMDGIKWFHTVVTGMEKWPDNMETETIRKLRQQLDDALEQLIQALENNDFFLINDILIYDLIPSINNLFQLLIDDKLGGRIEIHGL